MRGTLCYSRQEVIETLLRQENDGDDDDSDDTFIYTILIHTNDTDVVF